MTQFRISFTSEQNILSDLSQVRSGVADIGAGVRGQAASSIFNNFDRDGLVRKSLYDIADTLDTMNDCLGRCNDTMNSIFGMYRQTENTILGNGVTESTAADSPGLFPASGVGNAAGASSDNDFWGDFSQEVGLETVGQILEAAPYGVNIFARYFSAGYMPGPMGFAMYEPGSTQLSIAGGLAKVAPTVAKVGKIGVPVLGGILDFAGQVAGGEGVPHAFIKAAAHTGVGIAAGWAGGKVGAAVGSVIGSIIPGAGTVVGGFVGGVVGAVIGCAVSVIFNKNVTDVGYDRYIREPVNRFCEQVGQKVQQVGEWIGSGIKALFAPKGRVLGTIFG